MPVAVPTAVALVPARQGSKRVPGKNVRVLGGHPLLAYTLAAARDSGVFDSVIVSTDSEEVAEVARHYGAEVPFLRPAAYASDTSPDIEWLAHLLDTLGAQGRGWDAFALLRPTSPFRTAGTIRRAWAAFSGEAGVDSLRAVEVCAQHPGKMWVVRGTRMTPLLPFATPKPSGEGGGGEVPWHSTPYQALPRVHVQNASLEMAWTRVVLQQHTIAGEVVMPFPTEGHEGLDINDARDWRVAEQLVAGGEASLPPVAQAPYGTGRPG